MVRPPSRIGLDRLLVTDAAFSAYLAVPAGPMRLLALLIAHSGDSPLWLAGALAALLWGAPPWPSLGLRVLAATVAGGATATLLKWFFRRSRPGGPATGLYSRLDRHAFPSGHATRVACTAVILAPLLPGWGIGLLVAWAGLVSLARVALQIHYLFDVIVGMALGGLIGLVLAAALA
ncbi:MAG TPA: phosphatase PAP2 family protein [Chloroflexi bacterium]|nr:phosphatase PAP2 family protein [Chloroflexota bacterium]